MPTQQDIADIIMNVSSDLVKLEANEQKVILKKLKDMEKDLLNSLKDINPAASNSQLKRKERTLEAIAQSKIITKSYYNDIKKYNQGQLFEVAKFSNRHIVQEINKLYGVEKMTTVMTANKLKALVNDQIVMGEKLTEFWDGQTSKVVKSYRNQLQLGLLSNDTFNQLERRIRGTREMKFRDGIMQVPNNQARTYIRTSIQNTANSARTQTYRDNDSVVDGEEWFATLDLITSVICAALDGLKWTYPDYKPVGHNYDYPGPIAHPNCRSTQLPTIEGIDEEGGTRASAIGQIGGKTTYEDWLKNPPEKLLEQAGEQSGLKRAMTPEEFQNMKLGKFRAEQFRSGKLSLREMISPKHKNGTPLVYTIEELKNKYNLSEVTKTPENVIIKSRERVYKNLKEAYKEVKLNQIDSEFAKEIETELLDLANKYRTDTPSLAIGTTRAKGCMGDFTHGFKNSKGKSSYYKRIRFNKIYLKNAEIAQKNAERNAKYRGKIFADKLNTVHHEYGHFIDVQYALKKRPDLETIFKEYSTPKSINSYTEVNRLNAAMDTVRKNKLSTEIFEEMKKSYDLTDFELNKVISKEYGSYAASDKQEFLAEAFAEINLNSKKTKFKKDFEKLFKQKCEEVFGWKL